MHSLQVMNRLLPFRSITQGKTRSIDGHWITANRWMQVLLSPSGTSHAQRTRTNILCSSDLLVASPLIKLHDVGEWGKNYRLAGEKGARPHSSYGKSQIAKQEVEACDHPSTRRSTIALGVSSMRA